jgi:hypothetical protein
MNVVPGTEQATIARLQLRPRIFGMTGRVTIQLADGDGNMVASGIGSDQAEALRSALQQLPPDYVAPGDHAGLQEQNAKLRARLAKLSR